MLEQRLDALDQRLRVLDRLGGWLRRVAGDVADEALQLDELAPRVAALHQVVGVDQARGVVVGLGQDGVDQLGVVVRLALGNGRAAGLLRAVEELLEQRVLSAVFDAAQLRSGHERRGGRLAEALSIERDELAQQRLEHRRQRAGQRDVAALGGRLRELGHGALRADLLRRSLGGRAQRLRDRVAVEEGLEVELPGESQGAVDRDGGLETFVVDQRPDLVHDGPWNRTERAGVLGNPVGGGVGVVGLGAHASTGLRRVDGEALAALERHRDQRLQVEVERLGVLRRLLGWLGGHAPHDATESSEAQASLFDQHACAREAPR
ncbi:MAG: hypothetical protein QM765_34115 [Myxococcales bacterium]